MEDLRRIQNPVVTPQPIGSGARNQPGRRRKDEFRDIIERERRREDEAEDADDRPAESESRCEDESIEDSGGDPDRGILIDERA